MPTPARSRAAPPWPAPAAFRPCTGLLWPCSGSLRTSPDLNPERKSTDRPCFGYLSVVLCSGFSRWRAHEAKLDALAGARSQACAGTRKRKRTRKHATSDVRAGERRRVGYDHALCQTQHQTRAQTPAQTHRHTQGQTPKRTKRDTPRRTTRDTPRRTKRTTPKRTTPRRTTPAKRDARCRLCCRRPSRIRRRTGRPGMGRRMGILCSLIVVTQGCSCL